MTGIDPLQATPKAPKSALNMGKCRNSEDLNNFININQFINFFLVLNKRY